MIPEAHLQEIYEMPKVVMVKDSSGDKNRRAKALAARIGKPELQLFNGDEFRCVEYLEAGYDGCMFGGAVATMPRLKRISELLVEGKIEEAEQADAEMRRVLFGIYGGEAIACWLTGLKHYLVVRGLFDTAASYLGYPLTDECRAFIETTVAEEGRRNDEFGK